jgi:hypothetical protein
MSLGMHDGRFSLIATDPSRRAGLNCTSDHLGGSGELPVMVSSRSSIGPSDMRLAAKRHQPECPCWSRIERR